MPSPQIQGEIGFPEIVHDPAADFSAVERPALPVAQRDGFFLFFPERNQRGIGTGNEQIKGIASAQNSVLQAPELLACTRQLIQPRTDYTAGFVNPGFVVPVCLERKGNLDFFRVRAAFLFQPDPSVYPRKMTVQLQKQRALLARAISQGPELMILDEPTSYLDIYHKLRFIDILKDLAKEEDIGILMSVHELEIAFEVSDRIMCLGEDGEFRMIGTPSEVFSDETISSLYNLDAGRLTKMYGGFLDAVQGEIVQDKTVQGEIVKER